MLLKYWNNGWNYIDEISDAKWLNIDICRLYKEGVSSQESLEILHDENEKAIVCRWNSTDIAKSENGEPIPPRIAFDSIVMPEIYKILEVAGEDVYSLTIAFEDSIIDNVVRGNAKDTVPMIVYTDDIHRKAICFAWNGYLCNNNGKTIERIG